MTDTITYQEATDIQHRWRIDVGRYERYEQGRLAEQRAFTADDQVFADLVQVIDATGGNLLARVRTALTNDKVYLDKVQAGTATQADHAAQVATLTRQVQALIVYVVLRGT